MRENTRNYSRKVKSWTINKEKGMFKKEDIKVGRIILPGGEGCVMKRDTLIPSMRTCLTYTVQDVLDDYGKMLAECRTDSTTQELKREGE